MIHLTDPKRVGPIKFSFVFGEEKDATLFALRWYTMITKYDPLLWWSQQHKVNFIKIDKRYKRPKDDQFIKHRYIGIRLQNLKSMEAYFTNSNDQVLRELASWLVEHLPYRVYYPGDKIYFTSESDAIMFLLIWG